MTRIWWQTLPRPVARSRVVYTAPCPHGYQAEWMSDRVPGFGGTGDGVEVYCLCRCARCLLAAAVAT